MQRESSTGSRSAFHHNSLSAYDPRPRHVRRRKSDKEISVCDKFGERCRLELFARMHDCEELMKMSKHSDFVKKYLDLRRSRRDAVEATIQGFQSPGLSVEEAEAFFESIVRILCDMSLELDQNEVIAGTARAGLPQRFLDAASIGSDGAYLADGSEYSGDYGPPMTGEKLKDFHRRRPAVLAGAGRDPWALETIPCKLETQEGKVDPGADYTLPRNGYRGLELKVDPNAVYREYTLPRPAEDIPKHFGRPGVLFNAPRGNFKRGSCKGAVVRSSYQEDEKVPPHPPSHS